MEREIRKVYLHNTVFESMKRSAIHKCVKNYEPLLSGANVPGESEEDGTGEEGMDNKGCMSRVRVGAFVLWFGYNIF